MGQNSPSYIFNVPLPKQFSGSAPGDTLFGLDVLDAVIDWLFSSSAVFHRQLNADMALLCRRRQTVMPVSVNLWTRKRVPGG